MHLQSNTANNSEDNAKNYSFFSGVDSVEDCNFQIFNGQVNFNVHQPVDFLYSKR